MTDTKKGGAIAVALEDGRRSLPVSLVVTCYNEAKNVSTWCESLLQMDDLPRELVVVDSESTDGTAALISKSLAGSSICLLLIRERCTISRGRNLAVQRASEKFVAISDFGVTFDTKWLTELWNGFNTARWVGGCYRIVGGNVIQLSLSRLFDVVPSRVDEQSFLPSSRSFAIEKSLFSELGGYCEEMVVGEDTEFVHRLRKMGARYRLCRGAVVYWAPRDTMAALWRQSYRYAYWDGRVRQGHGRLIHIAFLGGVISPLIWMPLLLSNASGLIIGTIISLGLLYSKASLNTLRGPAGVMANMLDVVVYVATVSSGAAGYIAGLLLSIAVGKSR